MDIIDLIKTGMKYVGEDARLYGLTGFVPASEVEGDRQSCDCGAFDHEYVNQYQFFEDDYAGTVYLPLPNGEYMALEYRSC